MTNMVDLARYVRRATQVYRKGDVVKVSAYAITVDDFPALPEGTTTVDCHFVTVGFTEALAEKTHDEFAQMILDAAEGEFATLTATDWAGGPSYITIGAWIGDQTLAFQFMAACVAHGLSDKVITPAQFYASGPEADMLAGNGFVLLSPMALEVT